MMMSRCEFDSISWRRNSKNERAKPRGVDETSTTEVSTAGQEERQQEPGMNMLRSHANAGKSNNPYKKLKVHKMQGPESDQYAVNFCEEDEDLSEKMKELQGYVEMVQQIVKPGCSLEMVEVALHSMASLVEFLSSLSLKTELISSL